MKICKRTHFRRFGHKLKKHRYEDNSVLDFAQLPRGRRAAVRGVEAEGLLREGVRMKWFLKRKIRHLRRKLVESRRADVLVREWPRAARAA